MTTEILAVALRNENTRLRSLIELMALHVPRDRMPAAERSLLDGVIGAPT